MKPCIWTFLAKEKTEPVACASCCRGNISKHSIPFFFFFFISPSRIVTAENQDNNQREKAISILMNAKRASLQVGAVSQERWRGLQPSAARLWFQPAFIWEVFHSLHLSLRVVS